MNTTINKTIGLLGLTCIFGMASAAPISFDFTSVAPQALTPTVYSADGDIWEATNVTTVNGTSLDAVFEIIDTSVGAVGTTGSTRIGFVNDESEGQDLRMRFNNDDSSLDTPVWAKVIAKFYETGTLTEFEFEAGDSIVTQFDDLDSDFTLNRSDFAGIQDGDFGSVSLNGTTNLEINTTLDTDYTIGILQDDGTGPEPYDDWENEPSTAPVDQAPWTVRFNTTLADGTFDFSFIMGYDDAGASPTVGGNRHIDMDMTGVLIPEPGTLMMAGILLGSFAGLHLIRRRKR